MRSAKDWVEDNVKILDVLDRLGYAYRGSAMLEQGKETDGWKIYPRENMVNDFSKDRPSGSPRVFVWKHFAKDAKRTEERYKENYNLPDNKNIYVRNKPREITKTYAEF